MPEEARKHPNFPFYGSDIKLQTDYILKNLVKTFKAAGTSLDNVFKAQVFLMDLNDFAGFDEVWRTYFKSPPPRTTVGTTGLLVKDTLVEIDLIAALPGKNDSSDQVWRTRSRWRIIPKRFASAISFSPPVSLPAISRPAFRRQPGEARTFRSTDRTSSSRRNSSCRISS